MIRIHFSDIEAKKLALARLAGRFPFKSWATGEMAVPDEALPFLKAQGVFFSVEGPVSYEQSVPAIRSTLATSV